MRVALNGDGGIVDGSIELPPGLLVLVPEEPQLTVAEQRLLPTIEKRSTICRPNQLESFSDEAARKRIGNHIAKGEASFDYFSGHGEVNEIRGVLQRILSQKQGGPLSFDDVEILHTDYHQYVPLLLELLSTWLARSASGENNADSETLPAVDAARSRSPRGSPASPPQGRALRGWLRWARHDFVESKESHCLREGLSARPDAAAEIGYARMQVR